MFVEIISAFGSLVTTSLGILAYNKNPNKKIDSQIKVLNPYLNDVPKLEFAKFVLNLINTQFDTLAYIRFGTMYAGIPYTDNMKMKMVTNPQGTVFQGWYGQNHRFTHKLGYGEQWVEGFFYDKIGRGSFGAMCDFIKWYWAGQKSPVEVIKNITVTNENIIEIVKNVFEEIAPEMGVNGNVCSVECSITKSIGDISKIIAQAGRAIIIVSAVIAAIPTGGASLVVGFEMTREFIKNTK